MSKVKIDLHDIYNRGKEIDSLVSATLIDASENNIDLVEIIHGKGSGQLKKKILRLLNQKEIKNLYHRIDKDSKNHGRLFVRFKKK